MFFVPFCSLLTNQVINSLIIVSNDQEHMELEKRYRELTDLLVPSLIAHAHYYLLWKDV